MKQKTKATQVKSDNKCSPLSDQEYLSLVSTVVSPLVVSYPWLSGLSGALRARRLKDILAHCTALLSQQYDSPNEHFVAQQVTSLLRKYPYADSPFDPEGKAHRVFLAGERKCGQVNRKIRAYRNVVRRERVLPHLSALKQARDYIARVLGEFNLERVQEKCDFSDGANVGVHGNATNLFQKWKSDWSVTLPALNYAITSLWNHMHAREIVLPGTVKCHDPLLFADVVKKRVSVVDANKLGFVAKTVEVHRTIAVEPLLNGFLQKGVDVFMRARLRRIGIDLSDQARNAYLAKRGSESWEEADSWVTIDLSNASGSISKELVRLLLPLEWHEYLDAIRSSGFILDGKRQEYESFCSMGNGFCFPLETLIFASFCHAAGCDDFAVYGDDIIVRRSRALYLIELLAYFGFKVNIQKTFIVGPFRESCGSDYYAGSDVRPFVSDKRLDTLPSIFAAHNGTLRNERTESFFHEFRVFLRKRVSPKYRFVGLNGQQPDSYFVVPQDVFLQSPHAKWDRRTDPKSVCLSTWRWKAYLALPVPDPEAVDPPSEVDWYAVLRGARDMGPLKGESREPGTRPDRLHTLRYTTKRRVRWITAPMDDETRIQQHILRSAQLGSKFLGPHEAVALKRRV